jgi:hypothetical protein
MNRDVLILQLVRDPDIPSQVEREYEISLRIIEKDSQKKKCMMKWVLKMKHRLHILLNDALLQEKFFSQKKNFFDFESRSY